MSFLDKFFLAFNPSSSGYVFMWVLLAVAVFGLAIAIERFIFLAGRGSHKPELFMKEIFGFLQSDDTNAALGLCGKARSMALAQVVKAGLNEKTGGADHIRNAIEEASLKIIPRLEKRTNYLATIGNIATLLGLMGTIYGLIIAFAAVGKPGIDAAEKSTLLASGISAAMNTTFFGLAIAIPSIVLYSFFRAKTQRIIDDIDEYSLRLINLLIEKSYKTHKYHISASQLQEGVGLHVTHNNIKIFTDNKLIKEITI